WTDPDASGLQSIVWRKRWEETGAAHLKDALITYNLEDCAALQAVTGFVYHVGREHPMEPHSSGVVADDRSVLRVEALTLPSSRREWQRPVFAVPAFEFINERAHFDYQRERVFVRTNPAMKRRMSRKRTKRGNKDLHVNQSIVITCDVCPYCGGT